jgi:acylphosphatase
MMPIKKRIEVIARGEVQAVGYREFVRKATFRRMITGFVQNIEDGRVKIVAEGFEEELKNFLTKINVSEYQINVSGMDIKWDNASENFTNFEIIRGDKDSELFERIDIAGTMLYKLLDNSSTSLVKQDQMINKQDIMIDLQADKKDEIKNLRGV